MARACHIALESSALVPTNDFLGTHAQMLVLLGEVGGADEYDVCDALKSGRITKPLVAWCIGTCASIFPFEVSDRSR